MENEWCATVLMKRYTSSTSGQGRLKDLRSADSLHLCLVIVKQSSFKILASFEATTQHALAKLQATKPDFMTR